jgi:hypothetical protein
VTGAAERLMVSRVPEAAPVGNRADVVDHRCRRAALDA